MPASEDPVGAQTAAASDSSAQVCASAMEGPFIFILYSSQSFMWRQRVVLMRSLSFLDQSNFNFCR